MRKVFICLVSLVAVLGLSSCEQEFAIEYNVNVVGDAEGDLLIDFPNGSFGMDGKADLDFVIGSPDSLECLEFADWFMEGSSKEKQVALQAYNEVESINATSAKGSYYLHIVGYAEEKATGVRVAIDKTLTNR